MLDKRGPKFEPCGTPSSKSAKSLKESITAVLCFLSASYEKLYAPSLATRKRARCSQRLYSDQ